MLLDNADSSGAHDEGDLGSFQFLLQNEAEVPVPDRLYQKGFSKELTSRLKLSQKIGLLLWLNREGLISEGGKERLLYLQRKSSFEAIEAGLKSALRLSEEKKLSLDFKPHMVELNRRPQSRRYRVAEKRRIGIGYRDKGTLPVQSSRERIKSTEEAFINIESLSEKKQFLIKTLMPSSLEEDWVDLEEVLLTTKKVNSKLPGLIQFLNLL